MKFRFPVVIIDEDFRSENASGLGIRALAAAIEKEGMEVLGVTSYGDLSQFAQPRHVPRLRPDVDDPVVPRRDPERHQRLLRRRRHDGQHLPVLEGTAAL